jgi:hypothetical protein
MAELSGPPTLVGKAIRIWLVWLAIVASGMAVYWFLDRPVVLDAPARALLWPLSWITGALTWAIDALGPQGRPEAASMYLTSLEARFLAAVSLAVYLATTFGVCFAVAAIHRQRRRRLS